MAAELRKMLATLLKADRKVSSVEQMRVRVAGMFGYDRSNQALREHLIRHETDLFTRWRTKGRSPR